MSRNSLASTGIAGLDHVLRGGLPRNHLYLVGGNPGAGKTTLGFQFLLEGVRAGEKALHITLSESREELEVAARSHGWSLQDVAIFELSTLQMASLEGENYVFHPDEIELTEVMKTLQAEIERVKPRRVVFDSLSELRLLSQGPLRYRHQIMMLKRFFAEHGVTCLLLDDHSGEGVGDLQLESICHGVMELELSVPSYGVVRRRLQVTKLRGCDFRSGYHDFAIRSGGIVAFPRLMALEYKDHFKQEILGTGIPGLDALLGGGIHRGRSVIIAGAAGLGKSTIAAQLLVHASAEKSRGKYFLFDERPETLLMRSKMLSVDLESRVERGLISLQQVDPAEMSPGEFNHRIREAVEEEDVRLVAIDSINGFLSAMPDEKDLVLQLHELITYLGQRGVMTVIVLGQQGLVGADIRVPVDLSYLSDTVIFLRYFENRGELLKAISVVKQRTGDPELTIREFNVDKNGIRIGNPLREFQGILTGAPQFTGKRESLLDRGAP